MMNTDYTEKRFKENIVKRIKTESEKEIVSGQRKTVKKYQNVKNIIDNKNELKMVYQNIKNR